ncbi:PEP-CTERM sorting domain-containing protein [Aeoliella mucimassa]|uniref:Ice-binding protein C-terminal domain-containing protein n=1 Tax=Aeoliella mucimassa TaxID=2527972 RepID=A0A518AQ66_9BACT|nr:PEP-CTERM sorting domain-containing protein [Aeoliella mucimassa]QDU56865.1 hypothetical protein Pan181_30770 [Aeoliella mucimassa]
MTWKHHLVLSALCLPLLLATTTNAAVITEDFDSYTDGVIGGQNDGVGWGDAWGATTSVNDPVNEFEVVSGVALMMGNSDEQLAGGNQEIITHSRPFADTVMVDTDTTLTLSFDLIVNETQLGRGVGINLTDSTNSQMVFIGKQINQAASANGVHSSIGAGGDDYTTLVESGSGSASLVATFTSDGTDTFVSLTNGTETVSGTIAGTQFAFDGLDLTGYHRQTRTNGVDNISIDVTNTAVPEPSTIMLSGLAAFVLVGIARRK